MSPRPFFKARHEGDWTYWDCVPCGTEVTKQLRRITTDHKVPKAKSAHQCPPPRSAA